MRRCGARVSATVGALALAVALGLTGWIGAGASHSARERASANPFPLYLPVPKGTTVNAGGPHPNAGCLVAPCPGVRSSVDIGFRGAMSVHAAAQGTVTRAEQACDAVEVTYPNSSWVLKYLHVKNIAVKKGQKVAAGARLGDAREPRRVCGDYGSGIHVHLSFWHQGKEVKIDGFSLGGYTVHQTGDGNCGYWTRDGDPKHTMVVDARKTCQGTPQLVNNQRTPTTAPDRTAPSAPTHLGAVAAETSLALRWRAATDNVGVYQYELAQDGAAVGKTKTLGYTFRGLACGTKHVLRVRAYDAAGNRSSWAERSASTTVCAPTRDDPQATVDVDYWQPARQVVPRAYPVSFAANDKAAVLTTISQYSGRERAGVLSALGARWTTTTLPGPAFSGAVIAALPDGRFVAAWQEGGGHPAVSIRQVNGKWSPRQLLQTTRVMTSEEAARDGFPAVVGTKTGAAVAWIGTSDQNAAVELSRYDINSDTWSDPEVIESSRGLSQVKLGADRSGLLTVFWLRNRALRARDESQLGVWAAVRTLGPVGLFEVAEAEDGSALVAFPVKGGMGFYGRQGKGGWRGPHKVIRNVGGRRFEPLLGERWIDRNVYSVASSGGGSLIAGWVEIQSEPRFSNAVVLRFTRAGWQKPQVLATDTSTMESLAIGSSGARVVVAFATGYGGANRARMWVNIVGSSNGGTTFSRPVKVADHHVSDEHRGLVAGVGPGGAAMVSWGELGRSDVDTWVAALRP